MRKVLMKEGTLSKVSKSPNTKNFSCRIAPSPFLLHGRFTCREFLTILNMRVENSIIIFTRKCYNQTQPHPPSARNISVQRIKKLFDMVPINLPGVGWAWELAIPHRASVSVPSSFSRSVTAMTSCCLMTRSVSLRSDVTNDCTRQYQRSTTRPWNINALVSSGFIMRWFHWTDTVFAS